MNYNVFSWFSYETWLLLATIIGLSIVYCKRCLSVLKNLNIPHEDPGFLGSNYPMGLTNNMEYTVFEQDIELRKKFGDIYGKYQFLNPIVVVWDPKILKKIYIKEFETFPDRQKSFDKIQAEMNNAITVASGSQWKRIRVTLSPAFSSSKLKNMFHIVEERIDILKKNIKNMINEKDGILNPIDVFGRFTLDVVTSAAFSGNFHFQELNKESKTERLIREALSLSFGDPIVLLISIFPFLESLFGLFGYSVYSREFSTHITSLTETIIKSKKGTDHNRTDLLQQMLQNKITEKQSKSVSKGMTQEEIIGNSFVMILAGYETTAQTLQFLMYYLAYYPEVQEKLREEIQNEFEKNDGELSYEVINDLKYLTMCINETLRMSPAAPFNIRFCDKDIEIDGLQIKKGFQIHIPAYGLSNSEDFWEDPKSFKPERMEDMNSIDPLVFQPFGGGPRSCIGMRFAWMVMKASVAHCLLNYKVSTCSSTPSYPLKMTLKSTARPKEDIFLKFEQI